MVNITYFVHCTTADNEQGISTGWLPGELSAKGLQEAEQMGHAIDARHFDAVIVSDLKRAVDTAHIAFKNYNIVTDKRLREVNYGDNNGRLKKEFKTDMNKFVGIAYPNGESYWDVEQRLRSLCDELRQKYDGKHVALVAHEGPQLALDVIIKGKTWPQAIAEDWRITNA